MGRLDGKVALISGGARGQGATEARLFAAEGARVVIGDLLDEQGIKVEAEIRESGGEAAYTHLDVTSEADWVAAVETAVNRFGKLDILVNNAGITGLGGGGGPVSIENATEAAWDRVLAVNTKGVFFGAKHAIPEMRKAGGGSIVNISSVSGLVGDARPSAGAYPASKGAVRLLTKSTAIQYAGEGIRCNSVHPGLIETPMTETTFPTPQDREDRIAITPLRRIGTPEDIAYGVLYLASDESSYVTGIELVIDGGFTAQ